MLDHTLRQQHQLPLIVVPLAVHSIRVGVQKLSIEGHLDRLPVFDRDEARRRRHVGADFADLERERDRPQLPH